MIRQVGLKNQPIARKVNLMSIIIEKEKVGNNQQIVKIRPNLWQVNGHVIGYGALLAPTGLYFCFTCNGPGCQSVQVVDEAWIAGEDSAFCASCQMGSHCGACSCCAGPQGVRSAYDSIPFDGMVPDEPLAYDDEELIFASGIEWPEDYAIESYV